MTSRFLALASAGCVVQGAEAELASSGTTRSKSLKTPGVVAVVPASRRLCRSASPRPQQNAHGDNEEQLALLGAGCNSAGRHMPSPRTDGASPDSADTSPRSSQVSGCTLQTPAHVSRRGVAAHPRESAETLAPFLLHTIVVSPDSRTGNATQHAPQGAQQTSCLSRARVFYHAHSASEHNQGAENHDLPCSSPLLLRRNSEPSIDKVNLLRTLLHPDFCEHDLKQEKSKTQHEVVSELERASLDHSLCGLEMFQNIL